jgi:HD-like signal output (HDOD) protein
VESPCAAVLCMHNQLRVAVDVGGDSLMDAVRRLFSSPVYKPPMLPRVATQVMQLTRKLDVDLSDIVALVESDPIFAGQVLRVANSSVYGSGGLQTVKQAVLRVGLSTMRDICLQAAMNARIFRAPAFEKPMERLRQHSIAMAHTAKLICVQSHAPAEYAFGAGLLHGAGVAAAVFALHTPALWPAIPDAQAGFVSACHFHAELAGILGKAWELPEDLTKILGSHHQEVENPISAALILGDQLLRALGYDVDGFGTIVRPRPELEVRAYQLLGLSGAEVGKLQADLKTLLEELRV